MQGHRYRALAYFMLFFYNKIYATMVRETKVTAVSRGKIPRRIPTKITTDPESKGEK